MPIFTFFQEGYVEKRLWGSKNPENSLLKNYPIKKMRLYLNNVVQIYKRKLHTKNHIDWIKNEVPTEV